MLSKESNELLQLLDTLLCKNPDKCFRILESSMRCLPLPFFVLDSVDTEKNREPTCLYVDKCCEWIGSIITGLHNEGDRCLVEYTNRTLVVSGGIRIVIDDLEPEEAYLWKAVERDVHKYFRKVELECGRGVSFDSTSQTAFVKYGSCVFNSRIQEMLRRSSFILQFTVLFLYVKVDVTNRFTVGYKTLLLVCQKSYSQRSVTFTVGNTASRSRPEQPSGELQRLLGNDEQHVVRSADYKLQCILDSLFYYWYDLRPVYSTNVWEGSMSRSTVWATCWSEFEYIRSMHPTFSGQRRKALRGVRWEFRENLDHCLGIVAQRADKSKDHSHSCAFACHGERFDETMASMRRLLELSECAADTTSHSYGETRIIDIAHIMSSMYRKLIDEYEKRTAGTSEILHRSVVRNRAQEKALDSHKPFLYAMHVWGDGFDRVMANHIENVLDGHEEDGDLLPYVRSSAYLRGSRKKEDFPWRRARATAHAVHSLRRKLVLKQPGAFDALCDRVANFTSTHRAIRHSSEHMDMPFAFWMRCSRESRDSVDLSNRRRMLRCHAPQCEHLVDAVDNVFSATTMQPTQFDRTVAKELLHACYIYRDVAQTLTEMRVAYILKRQEELAQILCIARENGRFEEAERIVEAHRKDAEVMIIDFADASPSTGLLNVWHTVYEAMPSWTRADEMQATLLRVDEDLVALITNERTVRNLREAAVVLGAWSRDTISLDQFVKIVVSVRDVDTALYVWLLKYFVRTTWLVNSWRDGLLEHAQRSSPTPEKSARADVDLLRRMDECIANIGDVCHDDFLSVLETTNRGDTTIAIMKLLKGKRTRTDLPFEKDALVGIFNLFCSCAAEVVPVGLSAAESVELLEELSANSSKDAQKNDEILRKFCTRTFVEWCIQKNSQVRLKSIHCSKRSTNRSARILSAILRTFMCIQYSNRVSPTRPGPVSQHDHVRSAASPVDQGHPEKQGVRGTSISEALSTSRRTLLERAPALRHFATITIPVLTHPFDAFLRDPKSASHPLWSPYSELFETAACSYPRCSLFSSAS
ncbi:hypothetical protein CYMTET_35726 [Cymbomonas tetramitiformis]|uniref:Uncharacterized protein n=1 Tax=Cymbomonas tetramitiformis TaxID=36881 RepID=A0AAE0F8M9_9CHLO|nr:hypothetical protein CYMTET_35726 [Cymbomonas tetramitiformis]|eukprot:gene191-331_t